MMSRYSILSEQSTDLDANENTTPAYKPPPWVADNLQHLMIKTHLQRKSQRSLKRWQLIGVNLYEVSGGSKRGLKAFADFSAAKTPYTRVEVDQMWNDIKGAVNDDMSLNCKAEPFYPKGFTPPVGNAHGEYKRVQSKLIGSFLIRIDLDDEELMIPRDEEMAPYFVKW